jgi:isoamylase
MELKASYSATPNLLGAYIKGSKTSFALHAPAAEKVKLCLYQTAQDKKPCFTVDMEQKGSSWVVTLSEKLVNFCYTYLVFRNEKSQEIFDPFHPYTTASSKWGQKGYANNLVRSIILEPSMFNWEGIQPPNIPMQELIIYEMHIRGLTRDQTSNVSSPATFQGAIEKIPYLKSIGINAVELLPIQEFNESEINFIHPKTGRALTNYWGYSTVNFFSPMNRYFGSANDHTELKSFVKEMHRNQIEVILDVVYNHTGSASPLFICDPNYYILKNGQSTNYTGCGNTISANSKPSIKLIIESLKFLVNEFQIDGFRFDLASILVRSETGAPLEKPPLIEAIKNDPVLSKVKLISEPWDPGGLYQVGSFPLPFADWNGYFRDIARQYINGFPIDINLVQDVIKGSFRLFGSKTPAHSINFITVHDGFSLFDLVSYNQKHNEENSEHNRDGTDCNYSNNFGTEGANDLLYHFRRQQVYNFITFLFMSFGVPMMLMGDEMGMTHGGNNNPWCQDNEINWVNWNKIDTDILTFVQKVIEIRKSVSLFKATSFAELECVHFHQTYSDRVVCYIIPSKEKTVCVAFNPTNDQHEFALPDKEGGWKLASMTSRPIHENFKDEVVAHPSIILPAHSSAILY